MTPPTPESLLALLTARYPDTRAVPSWGERSLFYNPGNRLPRGVCFATVKEKNGGNDRASGLDRPGVFRVNFGPQKSDFISRFGKTLARPAKGGIVGGPWDFTALDVLTPHPVYGWMGWMAVLNPSAATLDALLPLIDSAHARARATFARRTRA